MTWIQNNTLKRQNVYDSNAFKKCKKWCHNLTYIVVIYIQVICKRFAVGTGISIAFRFCKIREYYNSITSRLRLWLKYKTLRLISNYSYKRCDGIQDNTICKMQSAYYLRSFNITSFERGKTMSIHDWVGNCPIDKNPMLVHAYTF